MTSQSAPATGRGRAATAPTGHELAGPRRGPEVYLLLWVRGVGKREPMGRDRLGDRG
jgi:hypothetical protein